MGRQSSCVKPKLRKGLWSPEEDEKLFNYITRYGVGCWSTVPKLAGLQRCGKSCRLRWINYLRPDLKRGMFSQQEEDLIISLHETLGNRWAQIAAQLPGRTDNEVKNFWNSSLKKKLMKQGIDPNTHKPLIETKGRDSNNCKEIPLLNTTQLRGVPTVSVLAEIDRTLDVHNSNFCDSQFTEASKDQFGTKPIFDPLFLYEFQESTNPIGYNSNQFSQYHQALEVSPNFGFTSMPSLENLDHLGESDFSDNSSSRMSSIFLGEVRESSSNCSNFNSQNLESVFQSQFNGIKSEELKPCPWSQKQLQAHNSEAFNGYPLELLEEDLTETSLNFFQQI